MRRTHGRKNGRTGALNLMYDNSVKKSEQEYDIDGLDCARYFSLLEPMPPVTAELDKWLPKRYYKSQKIHMMRWLRGQLEVHGGAYGRRMANHSTKVMYNRFQNPGGLLWMAEVLGEDEDTLRRAVAAAVEAEKVAAKGDAKSRCAAFRKVIPWERIAELLNDWNSWRFDPRMEPLIVIDDRTEYPAIAPGKRKKYQAALIDEAQLHDPKTVTADDLKKAGFEFD